MDRDYPHIAGLPGSEEAPPVPGSEPGRTRRRLLLWLELVIAVVLAVVLGLLAIGFLGTALANRQPSGTTRVGQIVGALVCAGLLYLATRWMIRVEHRLRRNQPIAQAFARACAAPAAEGTVSTAGAADATGTAPSARPDRLRSSRTRGRGRRHYGPAGTSVIAAVFGAATIGLAVGAASTYSQGVRSAFVQSHGIPAAAIVDTVDNTQQCSRSSCDYTAAIVVTLKAPVRGATTTVVHYPDSSDLVSGESIVVLVDPQQPGYAELPGTKFVNAGDWVILAIMAIVVASLTVLEVQAARRLFAYRRAHLAGSTGRVATIA